MIYLYKNKETKKYFFTVESTKTGQLQMKSVPYNKKDECLNGVKAFLETVKDAKIKDVVDFSVK